MDGAPDPRIRDLTFLRHNMFAQSSFHVGLEVGEGSTEEKIDKANLNIEPEGFVGYGDNLLTDLKTSATVRVATRDVSFNRLIKELPKEGTATRAA